MKQKNNNSTLAVNQILKDFNFKIWKKASSIAFITTPQIERIGTIFVVNKINDYHRNNVFVFDHIEKQYINSLSKEKKVEFFNNLKTVKPALIILTSSFLWSDINKFVKNCRGIDTTIVHAQFDAEGIYSVLAPYLSNAFASRSEVHGTLVNIFGVGVLLIGRSGIGKSEAAIDLVKKGHLFVADDAIRIHAMGNSLYGEPTQISKNFVAIKGVGILNVAQMFGYEKVIPYSKIDIVMEMYNDMNIIDRTFNYLKRPTFKEYEKIKLRKYNLSIITGLRAADIIETAVVDYKLKRQNIDPKKDYVVNFRKTIFDNFKK